MDEVEARTRVSGRSLLQSPDSSMHLPVVDCPQHKSPEKQAFTASYSFDTPGGRR